MENTIDILWYGRGGQGAFSAAKLLGAAYAFSSTSRHALAFPSFGPERRGAPVRAYTKLSNAKVNDRSAIVIPDCALCLDATLLADFAGMQIKEGGFVITTTEKVEQFAREVLGRPIVNTVLLSLLCAETGLLAANDIEKGIVETLPKKIQAKNIELVHAAFEQANELLEGALLRPSAEPVPQEYDDGFERMDLTSADAFGTTQTTYTPPSRGGSA